jgi:hypothetical protein
VGGIIAMPDSIDKKLRTICMKFTWGCPDKEKRCLTYKKLTEGGLNIPEFRSRLIAQRCNWISRLQSGQGIFRQVFLKDGMDWDTAATFATPFPQTDGSDFVDSCMDAWTDSLRLLKLDLTSLVWPLLSAELKAQTKSKFRCPGATCIDALAKSLPGLNFLERHSTQYQRQSVKS